MAITITNLSLSATYSKSQLEQNFNDISSKFGSITNSDIHTAAGIVPTKLSSNLQEAHICLVVRAENLAAGLPGGPTILALCPIPGSNGDTSWTVRDVTWVCTDTGAGTGQIRLDHGEFSAVGLWNQVNALVAAFALTNAAAANDANDGKVLEGGTTTIAYAATPRCLAILGTTADATTLSAAGSLLAVSVRMTRILQSA